MSADHTQPGMQPSTVIIVGSEPRIVVTIARSLARAGLRCIVAVPPDQRFRVSTKAVDHVIQLGGTNDGGAAMLVALVESEQPAWVVPCSDAALTMIMRRYDELATITAIGCPRPEIVERVLSKNQTVAAALRCGVPVPASVEIAAPADIAASVDSLRFPVIAKPRDKSVESHHGFKTRRFNTADELRSAFVADPAFGKGLLFQSYAPGEGVGVELLMHNNVPLVAFQHRRLAEYPPSGGVAVTAVSEPVDPRLLGYAVTLLKQIGWDGVAMVEFRHDRVTGNAALMEVNGRFWGSLALPVLAGVDFPLYAWQASVTHEPVIGPSYGHVAFRWTAGALSRFMYAFHKRGPADEKFPPSAAARELLSQLRPGIKSALWSWHDPLPALQELYAVLRDEAARAAKATIRKLLPASALTTLKNARRFAPDKRMLYIKNRAMRGSILARPQQLPRDITSVVFVCHGNIMRSAAAAQFLRDALEWNGITGVNVESAGAHAHYGRPADARVNDAVHPYGSSLDAHTSQPLTADIVADADVIFVMDDFNFVDVLSDHPDARDKVLLLNGICSIDERGRYFGSEIPDPYGTADQNVTSTVALIHDCVATLARTIANRSGHTETLGTNGPPLSRG